MIIDGNQVAIGGKNITRNKQTSWQAIKGTTERYIFVIVISFGVIALTMDKLKP